MTIRTLNIKLFNCWLIDDAIQDEPDAVFYIYEYYDMDNHVWKYFIQSIDSETMHYIRTTDDPVDSYEMQRLNDIIAYCKEHDIFTETYFYL